MNVDDAKVKIYEINAGFIGAYIKAGKHSFSLDYTPPLLVAGCIVSLLSLTLIVIFMVFIRKEK